MFSAYCFNGAIGIYARGVTEGVLVVRNFICLGSDYLCASGNVGHTVKYLDLDSISKKARVVFNMFK